MMERNATGDTMEDPEWHMTLNSLLAMPDETVVLPVDDYLDMEVDYPHADNPEQAAPVLFADMQAQDFIDEDGLQSRAAVSEPPSDHAESEAVRHTIEDGDLEGGHAAVDDTDSPLLHDHKPETEHDGDIMDLDVNDQHTESVASSEPDDSAFGFADVSVAKHLPIEIVLNPPSDPASYMILPPSETVERILDEVEVDGQTFFSVEYTDGRIEQVAYDDILQQEHGPRAIQQFNYDSRFNLSHRSNFMMQSNHIERRPEADYEDSDESEPEASFRPRRPARPARRVSRRTSRQTSSTNGVTSRHPTLLDDHDELNNEDDSLLDPVARNADDDDEQSSYGRNGTRVTRSRNPLLKNYNLEESADELSQIIDDSDSDGGDWILASDLNPKKPKKKRATPRQKKSFKNHQSTSQGGRESSIEFEPSRRSKRSTKPAKSMRDPDVEEDFFVVEDKSSGLPKIAAVKEVFRNVATDDPFRARHSTTCETCQGRENNGRGVLVFCQGCSYTYHKGCIGLRSQRDHRVTKINDEAFVLQCKFCIGIYGKKDHRAPDHALCQECHKEGKSCREFSSKKTPKQEEKLREENGGEDPITEVSSDRLNNPHNVLFRCMTCRRGWHHDHMPSKNAANGDDTKVTATRGEWKCADCAGATQRLHVLVAWRPVDQLTYRPGQHHTDYSEQEIEYLVKWEGRSHFHDKWMPGAWVYGVATPAMRKAFYKRDTTALPQMDLKAAVAEEWIIPDIIFDVKYRHSHKARSKAEEQGFISDIKSVYVKFQGLSYEETVWDAPPPRDSVWGEAPWEAFQDAFAEYLNGKHFAYVPEGKLRERIAMYRRLNFEDECELDKQPAFLKRGELMGYQLEGVNWLLYKFHQQENAILADEMGLGKTVQIVAFLAALALHQPKCWPFLVVVPNATCPNWRREIKKWAPDLRVVAYHGGRVAQQLAWDHELFPYGRSDGMKAHVVIMSFEAATNMKAQFGTNTKWAGLIVDEGQRLKNEDSLLYRALSDMRFPCRILLTGTPLQNNKRELFNLLQFIDPNNDAQALDLKYAELNKDNLPELHNLIRPYFLRRTKAQVLHFLPPMAQIILPVSMSLLQEKLCKSIMARNTELLKAIVSKKQMKSGERKSLNNILMDLRQCLCHPFCFNADVEDKTADTEQMHRNLVAASGKLMLLNVMLPKLQERGHRVLIFSQFLHSLTILEDFLAGLGLEHLRIDGSISALEKQRRIDAYNAPDSPVFAMLLSTRAGGVGINLYTADTVIIYDPDFNPHQDLQALSRAHRIGQKKKVLCFQLTTKNTAEEKIMQVGRKKMALDHALIESMDATEDAGGDLESILKHGAAALFGDTSEDKIVYDAASVDKLLDRSSIEVTNKGSDEEAANENQFSFARVWQNDKDELVENDDSAESPVADIDAAVWESILRERQEEHEREAAAKRQVYGRGARRKTALGVRYNKHVGYEGLSDNDDKVLTEEKQRDDDGDGSEMDVDQDYSDANDEDDDSETASATQGKSQDEPRVPEQRPLRGPSAPAVKEFPTRAAAKQSKSSSSTTLMAHHRNSATRHPPPDHSAEAALNELLARTNRERHPQTFVPPPLLSHRFGSGSQSHHQQGQPPPAQQQRPVPAAVPSHPGPRRGRPPKERPAKPAQKTVQQRLMEQMGTSNVHIAFYLSMTRSKVCVACGSRHAVSTSCIDFNSEVSLRHAIDAYRAYQWGNEYHNDLMKKFLRDRLMEVVVGRAAEQGHLPVLPSL
ncbi:uncharacterized protein B0I36DRAFT_414412 [Microdochium trichocladiopsis]|uniref:Chromatin remodeling factor mit1 n=1 Tax=Microdochium trichocladiopsis TaxID=1682393 RepID=A0A9P8XZK6_9PEZI|nr:uncharacterized protein B0I36DRAFT_414412 [Microdochium trichocladiopsis]KAH7026074.1 hypothetical protein B0I36DRAFT_414412 [Microdochium trichocladiopsis]